LSASFGIGNDGETNQVLDEIKRFLDTEPLLVDMIPALRQWIGMGEMSIKTHGASAMKRLAQALCRLLEAIASPRHPVVLFLDDLQWAESASVDLLTTLVNESNIPGFMLMGAVRSNELAVHQRLSVALREMECNGTLMTDISVTNFSKDDVRQFMADTLHVSTERVDSLSFLVYQHTGGNIFFIWETIRALHQDGHIYRDEDNHSWTWDIDKVVQSITKVVTIVEYLAERIQSFPTGVRDTLKTASCFGCTFEPELIQLVITTNVQESLHICRNKGIVEPISKTTWRFVHDQFQQSTYSLIPTDEKELTHLHIGRMLWSSLSKDERSFHAFSVVNQLRYGAHLISDEDERTNLAALLFDAGEKAMAYSSFHLASSHMNLALNLLGPRHWRGHYHLSLYLVSSTAEVEYCNANFTRMDDLIHEVVQNALNEQDTIRALTLSIYSLGSRNNLKASIELGLTTLKKLGFGLPASPSVVHIIYEMFKTKRMMKKYTDADILSMPRMVNADVLAAMKIHCIIFLSTLFERPLLAPIIGLRMVQYTLKHGLSGIAPLSFSIFGFLLCGPLKETMYGTRMSLLAMELLKMFDSKEWLPRVYSATSIYVFYGLNRYDISSIRS
jgi:predicted ATPase